MGDDMNKRPGRMATILVAYDVRRTLRTLAFTRRLNLTPSSAPQILVLNTPSLIDHQEIIKQAKDWILVQGTNEQHEISGWQEGLDYLMAVTTEPVSVLFMNDTVVSHRYFSVFRLMAFKRSISRAHSAQLIGFVDKGAPGLSFSIEGLALPRWVSTYCFFLTGEALERLRYNLWDKPVLTIAVQGGLDAADFFGSNVSGDLRRHIGRWLFEQGWHAAAPLCAENHDRMMLKARSIITELWLSARCLATGVEIVDPFERGGWYRKADASLVKYATILKRAMRSA